MPWGTPSRLYLWLNADNGVSLAAKADLTTLWHLPKRTCRIELLALNPALAGDADVQGLVGRTFGDWISWGAVDKLVLKAAKRVLRKEKGLRVFELGTVKITMRDAGAAAPQAVPSTVPEAKGSPLGQGCASCTTALKKPEDDSGSVNTVVEDPENDVERSGEAATTGSVQADALERGRS